MKPQAIEPEVVESKALEPRNQSVPVADIRMMAEAVAKSKLFGMKTADEAMALMLIAHAEGLHPAIAARDYHIIQGRPAKSAEAMLRSFLGFGGRVEWHEITDERVSATFSHPQGGAVRVDWDMERAKQAGLLDKRESMFKKYPRQMLRARVVSEGVRTVHPGATSGMYTPEEVHDFEPAKAPKPSPIPKPAAPPPPKEPAEGRITDEQQKTLWKIARIRASVLNREDENLHIQHETIMRDVLSHLKLSGTAAISSEQYEHAARLVESWDPELKMEEVEPLQVPDGEEF